MRIAVITGASSGLGREFALRISKRYGGEIDQVWLIARRAERLNELADTISAAGGCRGVAMPMDLTNEEDLDRLRGHLGELEPEIFYLVNAAGMAKIGNSYTIAHRDLMKMIDLNCRAPVSVTDICIPYLKKGSRLLQVCSTAAFQPMQGINVYAASKAFLLRYSQALSFEMSFKGIKVTAVCPYWIKNTDFFSVAKENESRKGSNEVRHFYLATGPGMVAAWSLWANRVGFWVSTPGPMCWVHRIFSKALPPISMMGWWELLRKI